MDFKFNINDKVVIGNSVKPSVGEVVYRYNQGNFNVYDIEITSTDLRTKKVYKVSHCCPEKVLTLLSVYIESNKHLGSSYEEITNNLIKISNEKKSELNLRQKGHLFPGEGI